MSEISPSKTARLFVEEVLGGVAMVGVHVAESTPQQVALLVTGSVLLGHVVGTMLVHSYRDAVSANQADEL